MNQMTDGPHLPYRARSSDWRKYLLWAPQRQQERSAATETEDEHAAMRRRKRSLIDLPPFSRR
jgi:hypothetical protein